jgi:tetratricopeptide (TPR) repeat protein
MRALLITLLSALPLAAAVSEARADAYDDAFRIVSDPKQLATRASEAVRLLRSVPATDPRAAKAAYNAGLLLHMQGDHAGAREAYLRALAADPKHAPSRAQLAGLDLDVLAAREEALATLRKLVEEDRFQQDARNLLAAYELERATPLLASTDKAAKAEGQKAIEEAIRHGRNVLIGDPENVHAFVNVAIAYMKLGLYDQADLIALSALEKQPQAAPLHNIRGLVALSRDDSKFATECFIAALNADPQNDDARMNLAALELAFGNFDSALKRFDEVLKQSPDDDQVLMSRGVALRGLGRFDEAEKSYREALTKNPNNPEIGYNLCVLHQQYTQRYELAKTHCEAYFGRLTKGDPKFAEVQKRVKAVNATLKALNKVP